MSLTTAPFPLFSGLDNRLLDNGYVWFGIENQDPETNPIAIFADEAMTIPLEQPLRTKAGVLSDGDTPVNVYAAARYSIRVRSQSLAQVYYLDSVSNLNTDLAGPDGAGLIGFIQTGAGAVNRDLLDKNREAAFSVADFAASPSATAAQNLARFKLAIAAASDGDIVDVPPGEYEIDTTGGLSAVLTLNKRITFRLRGDLKMNFSAVQANPPYIFNLTADGASVVGPGKLIGDGAINDFNTGDAETHPGLIRIAADGCIVRDITFVNPPKIGVLVYDCFFCDVSNNQFTGGPTVYGDTTHFGISVRLGGRHSIIANKFYPADDDGMFVQCIFGSGSNNCIIADNFGYRPYEKLVYWYGSGNLCSNNIVIGNDELIPGTNRQGTITTVFRFHGSFNTVTDNYTVKTAGGATCIDGSGNKIVDNFFLESGAAGIANVGSATNFDYTRIDGNTCTYSALAGFPVGAGILIASSTGPSRQLSVSQNMVTGFSVADPIATIPTWQSAHAYGRHSIVKPSVGNGRFYTAESAAGTSGPTEPAWPTTIGATVNDGPGGVGGVIWTAAAYEGNQAEIAITGAGVGQEIIDSTFADNNTGGTGSRYGIVLSYVKDSIVSNPRVVATEWGLSEGIGGGTCSNIRWIQPMVTSVGNVGVQNISSTSVLIDGKKIAWTPNPGAGLTPSGVVSTSGWYVRNSDQATIWGEINDTVGIFNASGGLVCDNLPIPAIKSAAGSLCNTDGASPSGCFVVPAPDSAGVPAGATGSKLYAGSTGTRKRLIFTITYLVA